ncbi:hypothetical protein PROFUN_00760 [Planoprotostelium fungivorum]|uniref:Uncharacterized protein n=1 Tax=Planoprotostelium fungivorum TaxID=1890364 RepID=A0A2P6NUA8_9EUKA|nr:hypothetical protein PROFUN_00760 [Planoprotostelium fungivorum]
MFLADDNRNTTLKAHHMPLMQCFPPSLYKACSGDTKAYKCFAENLQTDDRKQAFSKETPFDCGHLNMPGYNWGLKEVQDVAAHNNNPHTAMSFLKSPLRSYKHKITSVGYGLTEAAMSGGWSVADGRNRYSSRSAV